MKRFPGEVSLKLSNVLKSDDVRLTLVKDGGHRLSRDADIELIIRTAEELAEGRGDVKTTVDLRISR